jgi:hypothetical protein
VAWAGALAYFVVAPAAIGVLRDRALRILALEPDGDVRTVIVRATSDEASMALLAVGFGALVGQYVWRGVAHGAGWFASLLGWVSTPTTERKRFDLRNAWQVALAAKVVALLGLAVVGVTAFIPLVGSLVLAQAAGVGLGIDGLLLDVSAEAAPLGIASVVTLGAAQSLESLDLTSLRPSGATELAHSVYARAEALDWIGGAMAGPDGA